MLVILGGGRRWAGQGWEEAWGWGRGQGAAGGWAMGKVAGRRQVQVKEAQVE